MKYERQQSIILIQYSEERKQGMHVFDTLEQTHAAPLIQYKQIKSEREKKRKRLTLTVMRKKNQ